MLQGGNGFLGYPWSKKASLPYVSSNHRGYTQFIIPFRFRIVLGGTAVLHAHRVWGAVIFWSATTITLFILFSFVSPSKADILNQPTAGRDLFTRREHC